MTTIAFRNGIIAADSLGITGGNTKLPGAFQKIWRLDDGSLIGCAGDYATVTQAIAGAKSVADIRALSQYNGGEVLCIRPNSSMVLCSAGMLQELGKPEFYSIGSGATAALGALQCGATAEAAIVVAAKVDAFTDDRVQTLTFGGRAQMPVMAVGYAYVPAPAPAPPPKKWWRFW